MQTVISAKAKPGKLLNWTISMRTLFILYGTKASIYIYNGWQKADVDDVQSQLKKHTIAAEKQGGKITISNRAQQYVYISARLYIYISARLYVYIWLYIRLCIILYIKLYQSSAQGPTKALYKAVPKAYPLLQSTTEV